MAASEVVGTESVKKHKRKDTVSEEPKENGFDSEDDFSDPEGYQDKITDKELLGDILRDKPQEADGIESVLIVDNVPKVGQDRLGKLENVIRKIFSKFGTIVNEHYPKEEDDTTKGFVFLEFSNRQEATTAVKACNGYKLDKQHTFMCNLFSDFAKYQNVSDEWEEPETKPYTDVGNLQYFLLDRNCWDQYSVIYEGGLKTCVMLNTPREPKQLEEKVKWTETVVRWSPKGSYLATFHDKGIVLWGGEKFQKVMKFAHPGVQFLDYSPCERYVVTFSSQPSIPSDMCNTIFWCVRTGQEKRSFHIENPRMWPVFRWSPDGKYFARCTQDAISVYETPEFGLLDKRSIKVDGVRDIAWSPTDNVLAFWVEEKMNVPARVTIMEFPSRKELRVKNLFNVADCRMHWQKNGNYLCVKVDRYAKRKEERPGEVKYSGITHQLEIFHVREKQIPVDSIEIKETISSFAWEPNGHKFAVIHGESPRICVSFYTIKPKVEKIKTFEKKLANCLYWSPAGQFIVVAGLKAMNGMLEFIDTRDMTVMNQDEHFMATDVEWDPTGRYVITVVSNWLHKVDNAYWLWSFQGKKLQKHALDRVCQVMWRPRPDCRLTAQQHKTLKKVYMEKYGPQFAVEDALRSSDTAKELLERRNRLRKEFLAYRAKKDKELEDMEGQKVALRDITNEAGEKNEDLEEETIEFLIKEEQIIIEEDSEE